MRTFLQNLFSVFRLYSWATILNIVGLSVAFAVMYVIVRQSWYEFSFDKHYPEHELIYRVEYGSGKSRSDNFERPRLSPRLSASPHVKESGMCYMFASDASIYTSDSFTNGYAAKALRINKGYTDIFSFKWVSGNVSRFDLSDKNIIIPASMAKKIFGTADAAGKQMKMQFDIYNLGDVYDDYNIVAVYEDFPENSTIFNGVYVSLANFMEDVWYNAGFRGYVKVNKKENVKIIEDAMTLSCISNESKDDRNTKLFPMDDIYFHSRTDSTHDMGTLTKRGDIRFTWLLLSFALLVISVAMINFSNFSMALAPGRIKSFNTQKVLGASLWALRFQYLMECVAISFIAFLISLLIVQIAIICGISKLFIIDVSLGGGASIVAFCAIVAIIIGLVVGIYPAVYMTSVPAAIALKGSFRLSPKGLYFRNLLIGFQFIVAFVFLIICLFFYLQNRYMLTAPLGFDKDRTVVVRVGYTPRSEIYSSIENGLKNYAGAEYVFATDNLLLNASGIYQGWGREGKFLSVIEVTPDIIPGLGIEITEGRAFNPDEVSGKMLVNESARRKYEFKLGDWWNGYEIIGFIPDIKIHSFYKSCDTPLTLLVGDEAGMDRRFNMYMKLKPGVKEKDAIAYCKKVIEPFELPEEKIPVLMLEDVAEDLYEEDINRMILFSLFCGLSMFIAVMGVFGLIMFELQSRRKEIGIRKINGATVLSVVALFNKTYIRIMLICFVISVPVAWYFVQRWLEAYVYRIPLYWWVFAVAFFILLVVVSATVSLQCWHTANENPVKSLKMNE